MKEETLKSRLKGIYKPEQCLDENDCQYAFDQLVQISNEYSNKGVKMPYELINRYIETRNKLIDFQQNNNNKNKTQMKKTEIQHELESLKSGADSEKIKKNPVLAESIQKKIAELEEQLASIDEEHQEEIVTKEPKAPKEPKVAKTSKEPKAPKEPKKSSDISVSGIKIGDNVKFEKQGTEMQGVVLGISLAHGQENVYNAKVRVGDTNQTVRLAKLKLV